MQRTPRVFKYNIIKSDILESIKNGKFRPGDKIFSENQLKKMYDVSSTTVVKALKELEMEGYLIRRQGEGTFVRRNIFHRQVLYSEDIQVKALLDGSSEKLYALVSKPIQDYEIAEKFNVSRNENLLLITQMGVINDQVWKIQNRFILAKRLNGDSIKRIQAGNSVSKELGYDHNIINFPMETKIHSGNLQGAKEIIQSNMEQIKCNGSMDKKKPLLVFYRKVLDFDGVVIEYDITYIDSDFLEVSIETI